MKGAICDGGGGKRASERARGLCTVRRVLAFGPITTPSITTNNRRSPPPRGSHSDNKLRS